MISQSRSIVATIYCGLKPLITTRPHTPLKSPCLRRLHDSL
jgi:hypothetical protein